MSAIPIFKDVFKGVRPQSETEASVGVVRFHDRKCAITFNMNTQEMDALVKHSSIFRKREDLRSA